MTEKTEKPKAKISDILKWPVIVVLFLSGFSANYYFAQEPLPLRLSGWVLLVFIAAAIAIQTSPGQRLWYFFKAARSEVRKVVWPTRQETFQTTLVVIGIIIVFAVIMWGADSFLMGMVTWLTGQRG